MMRADDPRHGTPAGYDAHRREGYAACGSCRRAAARYEQELRLDHLAGRPRTIPALGTARRIQALVALGYTFGQIGDALGVCHDQPAKLATPRPTVRATTAAKVAALYDAWCMTLPPQDTGRDQWRVAYAKTVAGKRGWAPPLAWDDIDDPDEEPTGWEYRPPTREELLEELVDDGVGITAACRALDLSRDALQKWCSNNGLSHLYRVLAGRELQRTVNAAIAADREAS